MPSKGDSSDTETPSATPSADVKAKFREALARKNGQHADGVDQPLTGPSGGVHDEHGPAHVQRTFRRKSG